MADDGSQGGGGGGWFPTGGGYGMAGPSLTDVLTTFQNLVQATSTVGNELIKVNATSTTGQLTANTLVQSGLVRVLGLSVSTAGAAGTLHDAATIVAADTTNIIYTVAATAAYYPFFPAMLVTQGLVYKPGAGQKVTIFYVRS
jgi:hypothetical protein